MNSITCIILGIIQGLTEFLPISSSGHLVLFQNLLGMQEPELLIDTALHCGTLVAVCVYFRTDLGKMITGTWRFIIDGLHGRQGGDQLSRNHYSSTLLVGSVVIGSIPTALIGLVFKTRLEALFGSVTTVGIMLIGTGMIILVPRFIPPQHSHRRNVNPLVAIVIGIAQGFAIIPGISRSGATIVCGMLCGLDRELAARFSFLLSIPAIMGALLLQIDSVHIHEITIIPMVFGFFASALIGLLALRMLMFIVNKNIISLFAPYCWLVGAVVLLSTSF